MKKVSDAGEERGWGVGARGRIQVRYPDFEGLRRGQGGRGRVEGRRRGTEKRR